MPDYPHPELSSVTPETLVDCGDDIHAFRYDAQLVHNLRVKVRAWKALESLPDSKRSPFSSEVQEFRSPSAPLAWQIALSVDGF